MTDQKDRPEVQEADDKRSADQGDADTTANGADTTRPQDEQDPDQDSDLDTAVETQDAAEQETVAAEELSPLEIMRQERDLYEDRWLRSVAELENYRKRIRRELDDTRRFSVADIMRDLLELLDDFERALQSMRDRDGEKSDLDSIQAGVELTHQRLRDVLTRQGLRRIEAMDQEFDPSLHEAIQQVEKEGTTSGQIVEVVQTGYMLHDMVLRPSRVVVAK